MTDTEAKALALVNALRGMVTPGAMQPKPAEQIVREAAEFIVTTEARHAAELRELKERFDAFRQEVSVAVNKFFDENHSAALMPFIIAKPDPLAEALEEADAPAMGKNGYDAMAERTRAAMRARGYEWRKIGGAGE